MFGKWFSSSGSASPQAKGYLILGCLVLLGATVAAIRGHMTPAQRASDTHLPGVARVCLIDETLRVGADKIIEIPATAVFEDKGTNLGKTADPASWEIDDKATSLEHAEFITMAPVSLSDKERCGEVKIEMLQDALHTESSAKASANHVFAMTDVLDYSIPARQPDVEMGKLIDDVDVVATIAADVGRVRVASEKKLDEISKAKQCLAGAQKLAAFVHGGLGTQTSTVIPIGGVIDGEVSYGCAVAPHGGPDLFVGWDGQAEPPAATEAFIMKSGAFLTGATPPELKDETSACVREALKSESESASGEVRGVRLECQAFARDGGGGSITVYRRFGTAPDQGEPSKADARAVDRSSADIRRQEQARAKQGKDFASWYQDSSRYLRRRRLSQ